MSIEKNWNEIDDHADKDLNDLLRNPGLSKLSSHNPLVKIRRNLVINMCWAVAICLGYIFIILYFHVLIVQLCIGVVLIFSLWALYTAWQQFKNIDTSVSPSNSLVDELKRQHQSIVKWMQVQLRVALFIYPVSAAGGFILGGVIGSQKPVEVFFSKTFVWVAMIIVIALMVPAAHYLSKKLFKMSFGKHLDVLKKNIEELEEKK